MPSEQGLIIPGDKNFRFGPFEVNRLHDYSDKDTGSDAQHHTLGLGANQAAPGNHNHYKNTKNVVTPFSYNNGWVPYDSVWGINLPSGWWKDSDGLVHLQGLIKPGTTTLGIPLVTLPVEARPYGLSGDANRIFPAAASDAYGEIRIYSTGEVHLVRGSAVGWVNLSGIYFRSN